MVAVAIGSGALALTVGLAGPALADGNWAAASGSSSTGDGGFGWGPNGKKEAESTALQRCAGGQGNPKDCTIIASSAQCVAIATSPSNNLALAGGSGPTPSAASAAAVAALKGKGVSDAQVGQGNTACGTDPVS